MTRTLIGLETRGWNGDPGIFLRSCRSTRSARRKLLRRKAHSKYSDIHLDNLTLADVVRAVWLAQQPSGVDIKLERRSFDALQQSVSMSFGQPFFLCHENEQRLDFQRQLLGRHRRERRATHFVKKCWARGLRRWCCGRCRPSLSGRRTLERRKLGQQVAVQLLIASN